MVALISNLDPCWWAPRNWTDVMELRIKNIFGISQAMFQEDFPDAQTCEGGVATDAPKLQKAYRRFSWMESVLPLDMQTLQQSLIVGGSCGDYDGGGRYRLFVWKPRESSSEDMEEGSSSLLEVEKEECSNTYSVSD